MWRWLGSLWVAPVAALIWLGYLLPLLAIGHIRYAGRPRWCVARFFLVRDACWYSRAWAQWGGCGLPFATLMNEVSQRGERHELRHTDQWLVLGPLFPVVYGALRLLYGYARNPLERDAVAWSNRAQGVN